jgi:hypothetical protein
MNTYNSGHRSAEPIAIVGSGCRFPGGCNSPSKLWELLQRPRDLRAEIPSTRFDSRGFYHANGEHRGVRMGLGPCAHCALVVLRQLTDSRLADGERNHSLSYGRESMGV